jgi:diguanylate cyclase (GGDEF)-like protein
MTASKGGRISLRLLAIVLLPLLALAAIAAREVTELKRHEDNADVVLGEVDATNQTLALYVAMIEERIATEALTGGTGLGLTPQQTGALLGFDVLGDLVRARSRVDVALRDVDPVSTGLDLDLLTTEISRLRVAVDAPKGPPVSDVRAVFDPLQEHVSDVVIERVDAVGAGMALLVVPADAWDQRVALEQAGRTYTMASWQIEWLSALLVPSADAPERLLLKLQEATALYTEAIAGLPTHLGERALAEWTRQQDVINDGTPFHQAVTQWLDPATRATGPLDLAAIGTILRSGLDRNVSLRLILEAAGEDLRATVVEIHDEATSSLRTYLAAVAVVVLLTVALLSQTARSIVRPLRRLEDRAVAVSSGALHHAPLSPKGPREVRVVTAAFNEAVANLGRVDQVASALAGGTLNDDAITSVPGGIGESLRGAVERLSRSIRQGDELQERLRFQANHDVLTGLLNRRGIEAHLDERASTGAPSVAVLFVDLDGFKGINDALGHRFGDKVLQVVAQRLVRAVGPESAHARFGGDQWVAVLPDADLGHTVAAANAAVAAVSEPLVLEGHRITLNATVGIAFTEAGEPGRTTIRNADLALFEARRAHIGSVRMYDSSLRDLIAQRQQIEKELVAALAGGDSLEVHYQPVVAASDRRLCGVEALVRWRLPDGRLRPPSEFVPVAEKSDLIIDLDRWVLAKAMDDVARWRREPALAHVHLAVNISGRHLVAPTFASTVLDLLDLSGLDASALTLEITETVLLDDLALAREHLEVLRSRGVKIAIDDFGTGYTSVSQLRSLPADALKIDRSFISDPGAAEDRALVALVVEVSRTLQLEVVAEGVETEEQLQFVDGTG